MTDSTVSKNVSVYPCGCTHDQVNALNATPSGIHYSEDGSKAARHGVEIFFPIDPETKLPKPLDKGGFFRVGIDASNPKWLWMQYRIERKFLKNFHFKWLSSREVDHFTITIGQDREVEHDDILNAALKMSENRQHEIGRKKSVSEDSPLQKWVGDYPPKSRPVTGKVK